jgi:hypothetical protein
LSSKITEIFLTMSSYWIALQRLIESDNLNSSEISSRLM